MSTEEDTLSVNKISLSVLGFKKSVHPILFLEPLKRTIYLHCVCVELPKWGHCLTGYLNLSNVNLNTL